MLSLLDPVRYVLNPQVCKAQPKRKAVFKNKMATKNQNVHFCVVAPR